MSREIRSAGVKKRFLFRKVFEKKDKVEEVVTGRKWTRTITTAIINLRMTMTVSAGQGERR